jgi:predicted GTPase
MACEERKLTRRARRIVICGAAGRDFHNFNMVYRDDRDATVVAFTAAQIPGIAGRRYPAELAGDAYPDGIPIFPEHDLEAICRRENIAEVVFAYSDVTHAEVMHMASRALAFGADFSILGPHSTMLASSRPVVAISAVRTGCGKSQVARYLSKVLRTAGRKVAVLRHPMPYGDLLRQRVQRFRTLADLDAARCTLEEREEYEPHIAAGSAVFAGVDYAAVLAAAEPDSDVVLWDGGNNDFPFIAPTVHVVVCDALRPDQLTTHHPGETVLRTADVVVINKVDAAPAADVVRMQAAIAAVNPTAHIVRAASPVTIDDAKRLEGKRVLIVEDAPTITHGNMPYGAGYVAARALRGVQVVDPRDSAAPEILRMYAAYPHIGPVLPAMGYGDAQLAELRATINASRAEVVIAATPMDLARLGGIERPVVRARYSYADAGEPTLASLVLGLLGQRTRH